MMKQVISLNYYVWEFQHIAQDSQIVLYVLY